MKNKNYLSDQIRNNIPKRNIEEGRESVRMFVEMLKKRKINVIDEAILNRAYEEEDYVDEKMLGLVLKALKIDEPVQYIPRYIRNMNAFHANGTKVVVVDELLEYTLISFLFTMYSLENNRSEENVTRCMKNFYVLKDLQNYVGLTRAKDACYIMNGTARFRNKKNDYIFAEPSLFLSKPGLAERRKDVRWEM